MSRSGSVPHPKARSQWLRVRASAAEITAWQAKAASASTSVSELLRSCLDGAPQRRLAAMPVASRDTLLALARIGNSLNQLARWANAHKTGVEAVAVIARLIEIERALKGDHRDPEQPC